MTSETAKKAADRFNLIYFETCVKTGENVKEMLERLVSKIMSKIKLSNLSDKESIILHDSNQKPLTKEQCCPAFSKWFKKKIL